MSSKSYRNTRTLETFSIEVAHDIDYFTDEPLVQCDIPVVKNTFVDDHKEMIQITNDAYKWLQINFDVNS